MKKLSSTWFGSNHHFYTCRSYSTFLTFDPLPRPDSALEYQRLKKFKNSFSPFIEQSVTRGISSLFSYNNTKFIFESCTQGVTFMQTLGERQHEKLQTSLTVRQSFSCLETSSKSWNVLSNASVLIRVKDWLQWKEYALLTENLCIFIFILSFYVCFLFCLPIFYSLTLCLLLHCSRCGRSTTIFGSLTPNFELLTWKMQTRV